MKVTLALSEAEEAAVVAAAAAMDMTVQELVEYEVRASVGAFYRLGARIPASGGTGRLPIDVQKGN